VVGATDPFGGQGSAITPLFPLPNVFLFPGARMPLHVFEPRYRQMVQDLLDGNGRLVMGTMRESPTRAGSGVPPVLPIAGLGEIFQHERLPDGRFLIWLHGLVRVHLREAPSERLYRRVEVRPVCETVVCPSREALVREKLERAVLQRCPELDSLPPGVPLAQVIDLLLLRLQLPQSALEPLFCELDLEQRALGALLEHARRPLTPGTTP